MECMDGGRDALVVKYSVLPTLEFKEIDPFGAYALSERGSKGFRLVDNEVLCYGGVDRDIRVLRKRKGDCCADLICLVVQFLV